MNKSLEFYQNYIDRLSALLEGPEGYDLGEENRDKAVVELIKTLPLNSEKVRGLYSSFPQEAFSGEDMADAFIYNTDDNLRESVEKAAEIHWEERNAEMSHKLDKATMLMHYMKDLSGDAMKEADKLFKEGAKIATAIGLELSDHKFEVNVSDPNGAYFLKTICQPEIDQNRDDYVTVDIRVRSNQDRPGSEYPARIEFYGNEDELLKMVSFVASEDTAFEKDISPISKSAPRVPGFIDGDSFRSREVIKKAMNQSPAPSMSA